MARGGFSLQSLPLPFAAPGPLLIASNHPNGWTEESYGNYEKINLSDESPRGKRLSSDIFEHKGACSAAKMMPRRPKTKVTAFATPESFHPPPGLGCVLLSGGRSKGRPIPANVLLPFSGPAPGQIPWPIALLAGQTGQFPG